MSLEAYGLLYICVFAPQNDSSVLSLFVVLVCLFDQQLFSPKLIDTQSTVKIFRKGLTFCFEDKSLNISIQL